MFMHIVSFRYSKSLYLYLTRKFPRFKPFFYYLVGGIRFHCRIATRREALYMFFLDGKNPVAF